MRMTEIQSEAEKLSVSLRHSLADCLYLVVARKNGIPLITADQPFIDAVASSYPNIHHLSKQTS
jgi:predicted nucleic acid-binding protein